MTFTKPVNSLEADHTGTTIMETCILSLKILCNVIKIISFLENEIFFSLIFLSFFHIPIKNSIKTQR